MEHKRKRKGLALRGVVMLLAVGLLVAAHRGPLGQRAALLAVGLRQPAQAVQALEQLTYSTEEPSPVPTIPTYTYTSPGDTTVADVPMAPTIQTPPITTVSPPDEKGDGGRVIEQVMNTGDRHKSGIATINRSGTAVDIAAALARELTLSLTETKEPQVLILHTHGSEGYMTYDAGYYNAGDRNRTEDHTKNVCAVGEAVRLTLEAYGITAIHDTTVHDRPVYSGAYTRSAAAAQAWLEQYPSIQVVLDLHRDAVMQGSTDIVKPTAEVEGKKAAQMMLITGVVSTDALPHPRWQENLTFATRLQQTLDALSPDLMRPLNTVASRYNQHLSPGWVLVEMGAEGNTMEEAVYSARILGETLAELLD